VVLAQLFYSDLKELKELQTNYTFRHLGHRHHYITPTVQRHHTNIGHTPISATRTSTQPDPGSPQKKNPTKLPCEEPHMDQPTSAIHKTDPEDAVLTG
jgi:hypothetical protein